MSSHTSSENASAVWRSASSADILDGMKNHPLTFDNEIIRKILQCVIVESKNRIKVIFVGGLEVTERLD